ncbi:MAG: alpha-ketoglutarate-dependent dioxygenase AlkB [Phycisphaerae bacterium]|nr:alpha-ketoglutarate-dependent dioxygenase AlkB [Phycisphaerae bacterium]
MYDSFTRMMLDDCHAFFRGRLPDALLPNEPAFEELWKLHPDEYHEIKMHGRLVKTPRWQQAFGRDYHYTGRVNSALPVTQHLAPFLAWGQRSIDARLNGILLNWYDGNLKHYLGAHRDSRANMIEGTPIVTISLGAERVFR